VGRAQRATLPSVAAGWLEMKTVVLSALESTPSSASASG